MKKRIAFVLVLIIALVLVGCSKTVTRPMITIDGKNYVDQSMPVDELPEGYEYVGDLSKEDANATGLEGCRMYVIKGLDSFNDFYLYQECGTPVGENTVDSTQRNWAYVQWILAE